MNEEGVKSDAIIAYHRHAREAIKYEHDGGAPLIMSLIRIDNEKKYCNVLLPFPP